MLWNSSKLYLIHIYLKKYIVNQNPFQKTLASFQLSIRRKFVHSQLNQNVCVSRPKVNVVTQNKVFEARFFLKFFYVAWKTAK